MVKMSSLTSKSVALSFDDLKRSEKYFMMVSSILPRPIAVVGTLNRDGTDNLASFSYFNAVSSDPPCLMFSITGKKDGKKDTLINIEERKEFVVHIASAEQKDLVHATGEDLPYGVSEREKIGLSVSAGQWIKTPRVNEFPIAYECVLEKLVEVGNNVVVIGRILGVHYREELKHADEHKFNPTLLNPLARMEPGYGSIVDL